MKRAVMLSATFIAALAIGFGLAAVFPGETQAKPNDCLLFFEPVYYCTPSPSCKLPGEMICWECHGRDLYGELCLCYKLGCMIPPD